MELRLKDRVIKSVSWMYYAFGHVKSQVCVKIGKIHTAQKKYKIKYGTCTVNTI